MSKNSFITDIHKNEKGLFTLNDDEQTYNYVIIACPLLKTDVKFHDLSIKEKDKLPNSFQVNHKTVLKGELNPEYYGNRSTSPLPNLILSINKSTSDDFSSIGYKQNKENSVIHIQGDRQYTLTELNEKKLIKEGCTYVDEHHWDFAYPKLLPVQEKELPGFEISENLFHQNAIETIASTMELSIISARNIANIIENRMTGKKNEELEELFLS